MSAVKKVVPLLTVLAIAGTACKSRSFAEKGSVKALDASDNWTNSPVTPIVRGSIYAEIQAIAWTPAYKAAYDGLASGEYTDELTPCDYFYFAAAKKVSYESAGAAVIKASKAGEDVVSIIIGSGARNEDLLAKIPKQGAFGDTAASYFSSDSVQECISYSRALLNGEGFGGTFQHILADMASEKLKAGDTTIEAKPFFAKKPDGTVSWRTFKAYAGMLGSNGELKRLQDEVLAATAHFEQGGAKWKGSDEGWTSADLHNDLDRLAKKLAAN